MFPITKLSGKQGVFYLVLLAVALFAITYPLHILESGSLNAPIFITSFHRSKKNQKDKRIVSKPQQLTSQETPLPAASLTERLLKLMNMSYPAGQETFPDPQNSILD